jgi:hypothetical protein
VMVPDRSQAHGEEVRVIDTKGGGSEGANKRHIIRVGGCDSFEDAPAKEQTGVGKGGNAFHGLEHEDVRGGTTSAGQGSVS